MKYNINQTYWAGKGKNQRDFDLLYKKLVPKSGEADTNHGELLRSLARLNYDIYNNGACNLDVDHMASMMYKIFANAGNIKAKMRDKRPFDRVRDTLESHRVDMSVDLEEDEDAPPDRINDAFFADWEKVMDAGVLVVKALDIQFDMRHGKAKVAS